MSEFGLDYEALRDANAGVVYCSITGFGAGAGHLPGYDLLVQAVGGLMCITGAADGPPQKAGVAVVDVLSGLFAGVGILAALHHRARTGLGQKVEINLLSSILAALVNQGTAYTAAGVVATRLGNQHPSLTPYEPLRCRDRELVVAVGNDRQFAALCGVLGIPELAEDPRFATNPARVAAREELVDRLESRLSERDANEWAQELTRVRVPAGVVNDIASAFALAEQLGLEPIVQLERDDGTQLGLTRNPIGLSVTPPTYRLAPPALGSTPVEHAQR
jgi:crotonobetainyl-CoA:carnitine CoA-transferase CaiB-like acyl-CoA transferase